MRYVPRAPLPCITIDHDGVCYKLDHWIQTQAINGGPSEGSAEWEEFIHQLANEHPSAVVSESEESEDEGPVPMKYTWINGKPYLSLDCFSFTEVTLTSPSMVSMSPPCTSFIAKLWQRRSRPKPEPKTQKLVRFRDTSPSSISSTDSLGRLQESQKAYGDLASLNIRAP